jgi:hypothetical protein
LAPEDDDAAVEYLAMTTYYHATEVLGLGHTLPLGRAWRPGSRMDHLLVCKPYPLGPDLELFESGDTHGHIFWLLPITAAEKTYRHDQGLEALEARFDEAAFDVTDPMRESVV